MWLIQIALQSTINQSGPIRWSIALVAGSYAALINPVVIHNCTYARVDGTIGNLLMLQDLQEVQVVLTDSNSNGNSGLFIGLDPHNTCKSDNISLEYWITIANRRAKEQRVATSKMLYI